MKLLLVSNRLQPSCLCAISIRYYPFFNLYFCLFFYSTIGQRNILRSRDSISLPQPFFPALNLQLFLNLIYLINLLKLENNFQIRCWNRFTTFAEIHNPIQKVKQRDKQNGFHAFAVAVIRCWETWTTIRSGNVVVNFIVKLVKNIFVIWHGFEDILEFVNTIFNYSFIYIVVIKIRMQIICTRIYFGFDWKYFRE